MASVSTDQSAPSGIHTPGGAAGVAIGSAAGGIVLILFIISSLSKSFQSLSSIVLSIRHFVVLCFRVVVEQATSSWRAQIIISRSHRRWKKNAISISIHGNKSISHLISFFLVWYCRRKQRPFDDDEKSRSYNYGMTTAVNGHPASRPDSEDSPQSPTQIESMNHSAAWTEAYTAAFPQLLDSHSIKPIKPPTETKETGSPSQEATDSVSRLSRGTYDTLKTPLSPDSSAASVLGKQPGEEILTVPPPLVVRRQSTHELPA